METTVREQIKEHINKALSQSHGNKLSYDDLFKEVFTGNDEDDRCTDTKSMQDLENDMDDLINANQDILLYIQVDDANQFKAEASEIDEDTASIASIASYRFEIEQSTIYVIID